MPTAKTLTIGSIALMTIFGVGILLIMMILVGIGLYLVYNNTKIKYGVYEFVANFDLPGTEVKLSGAHPAHTDIAWWLEDGDADEFGRFVTVNKFALGAYTYDHGKITVHNSGLYEISTNIILAKNGAPISNAFPNKFAVNYTGTRYPSNSNMTNLIYTATGGELNCIIEMKPFILSSEEFVAGIYYTSVNSTFRIYLDKGDELDLYILGTIENNTGVLNTDMIPNISTLCIALL